MSENLPQIATRLYPILTGLAAKKETITYGQASAAVRWANARSMSLPLTLIEKWCANKNLPPLHVLVVQKETGLPGANAGLGEFADPKLAIAGVFDHDWQRVDTPKPADFSSN